MSTFFMFGKYSSEALKDISAARTEEAISLIKEHGGEVVSIYALLGEHDLVFIVDLPSVEKAMQVSIALNRWTGIAFSSIPAISVEAFDKLASVT